MSLVAKLSVPHFEKRHLSPLDDAVWYGLVVVNSCLVIEVCWPSLLSYSGCEKIVE